MYEKILVPLDGSKESETILDHVHMIAKSCGIQQVVLLRVVEPLNPSSFAYVGEMQAKEADERGKAAAAEYLSYVADPLRTHCGGVETVVAEGSPASVILDYASQNGVDLIAMSTHGESGPTRWTVGSATERVLRNSKVALLTVPPAGRRA